MNLLQTAKREYYTIRQSITENIGKTKSLTGLNLVGSVAQLDQSKLPSDNFEIYTLQVQRLNDLCEILHDSLKSLQTTFYKRIHIEQQLSSIIASQYNQLSIESNTSSPVDTITPTTPPEPDITAKFCQLDLSKKPADVVSASMISVWLDDRRKHAMVCIPDKQQSLLSRVALLKNSSVAGLLSLKNQTHTERTRYHAMLNWMHDASSTLNPENTQELENFRQIQQEVRSQKLKFETKMRDLKTRLRFCDGEITTFLEVDLLDSFRGNDTIEFRPMTANSDTTVDFETIKNACVLAVAAIDAKKEEDDSGENGST